MTKQRYNVSDIAEVLIDEIENFKKSAASIQSSTEKLQQTKVDINPQSLDYLFKMMEANQRKLEAHYKLFESIIKDNKPRAPNWLLAVIVGFFLSFIGVSIYTYTKLEYLKVLELDRDYYQSELEKVNKSINVK